jgi:hypothetical protein
MTEHPEHDHRPFNVKPDHLDHKISDRTLIFTMRASMKITGYTWQFLGIVANLG